MESWIIWIVVGITLFLFFKYSSIRYERVWTYILAVVFVFLLFTFFSVITHNEIDLTSFDGFVTGAKFYGQWLWGWAGNLGTITGNIVNIDWSGNFTNVNPKTK
jgi:hypothetical protein|tara:strand:+ start:228 stop:539 length:312 start_codon:yes stop_codon:yes gene_type:complete